MDLAEITREFACDDYTESEYSRTGWFDEETQCWCIEPASRLVVDSESSLLVIGRPGVDGIIWGYRRSHSGIWAYLPVDRELRWLASSVCELRSGWEHGTLKL